MTQLAQLAQPEPEPPPRLLSLREAVEYTGVQADDLLADVLAGELAANQYLEFDVEALDGYLDRKTAPVEAPGGDQSDRPIGSQPEAVVDASPQPIQPGGLVYGSVPDGVVSVDRELFDEVTTREVIGLLQVTMGTVQGWVKENPSLRVSGEHQPKLLHLSGVCGAYANSNSRVPRTVGLVVPDGKEQQGNRLTFFGLPGTTGGPVDVRVTGRSKPKPSSVRSAEPKMPTVESVGPLGRILNGGEFFTAIPPGVEVTDTHPIDAVLTFRQVVGMLKMPATVVEWWMRWDIKNERPKHIRHAAPAVLRKIAGLYMSRTTKYPKFVGVATDGDHLMFFPLPGVDQGLAPGIEILMRNGKPKPIPPSALRPTAKPTPAPTVRSETITPRYNSQSRGVKRDLLAMAELVLADRRIPMTAFDIWLCGQQMQLTQGIDTRGKSPWSILSTRLGEDIRENPNSVFRFKKKVDSRGNLFILRASTQPKVDGDHAPSPTPTPQPASPVVAPSTKRLPVGERYLEMAALVLNHHGDPMTATEIWATGGTMGLIEALALREDTPINDFSSLLRSDVLAGEQTRFTRATVGGLIQYSLRSWQEPRTVAPADDEMGAGPATPDGADEATDGPLVRLASEVLARTGTPLSARTILVRGDEMGLVPNLGLTTEEMEARMGSVLDGIIDLGLGTFASEGYSGFRVYSAVVPEPDGASTTEVKSVTPPSTGGTRDPRCGRINNGEFFGSVPEGILRPKKLRVTAHVDLSRAAELLKVPRSSVEGWVRNHSEIKRGPAVPITVSMLEMSLLYLRSYARHPKTIGVANDGEYLYFFPLVPRAKRSGTVVSTTPSPKSGGQILLDMAETVLSTRGEHLVARKIWGAGVKMGLTDSIITKGRRPWSILGSRLLEDEVRPSTRFSVIRGQGGTAYGLLRWGVQESQVPVTSVQPEPEVTPPPAVVETGVPAEYVESLRRVVERRLQAAEAASLAADAEAQLAEALRSRL